MSMRGLEAAVDDSRQLGRALIGTCIGLGVVSALLLPFTEPRPVSHAVWLGSATLLCVVPLALRRSVSPRLVAHLLLTLCLIATIQAPLFYGGLASGAVAWPLLTPVLAAWLVSPRAAVAYGGATATVLVGIGVAEWAGLISPAPTPMLVPKELFWVVAAASAAVVLSAIGYLGARAREATEGALVSEAEDFRILLDVAGDALIVHDTSGVILDVNATAVRLLGVSRDELVGSCMAGLVEASPDARAVMSAWRRGDGASLSVELRTTLLRSEPPRFVTVLRDRTEVVAHELALRSALEAAEREQQLKTQFLRSISHEIRTPLNAITGFSHVLASEAQGVLNSAQKEFLAYVVDGANQLRDVVETILDFGEVDERGHHTLVPIELHALTRDVIRALRPDGPLVVLKAPPELPHVLGHPDVFRRALLRLVEAARRGTSIDDTVDLELSRTANGVVVRVVPGRPAGAVAGEIDVGVALAELLLAELKTRLHGRRRPDGGADLEFQMYHGGAH